HHWMPSQWAAKRVSVKEWDH
ncbi:aminotransferase class-III family protein, partial [Vibrio parahaemolyticus VP2007-007]